MTVIMICVTWFIVSRGDKKRARETMVDAVGDNCFVTAPDPVEVKR